jgi:hypothetical protein
MAFNLSCSKDGTVAKADISPVSHVMNDTQNGPAKIDVLKTASRIFSEFFPVFFAPHPLPSAHVFT